MYKRLKKIYSNIIPSYARHKIEPFIRMLIYKIGYNGTEFYCPTCKVGLKKFIYYEFSISKDFICPNCGSLSRTRCLTLYIQNSLTKNINVVLDFSPHRSLYNYWKKKAINYIANDYENEFLADTNHDITSLPYNSEKFDLIICYHVLEHITDDNTAIKEMHRVLKLNGVLLAQVPFNTGKTIEDLSITSPEIRKKIYGQEDHVRFYGKKDFVEKLKRNGFQVNPCLYAKSLSIQKIKYHGLNTNDVIFICKKIKAN